MQEGERESDRPVQFNYRPPLPLFQTPVVPFPYTSEKFGKAAVVIIGKHIGDLIGHKRVMVR